MQVAVEHAAIRKAAWRILPLVALGFLVAYLDRVNLSFAALTMNRDLGLDAATFGMTAGIFFLGYCLLEVPSNLILERVGARRWLARIMITWGLVAGATAFVTTAFQLNIVRFLLGVAEAGFGPGVLFFLCLWFPKKWRAQMTSYFLLASPAGAIVGGPLAALLLSMDGFLGFKGWQLLFLLEALPAVVLGIVIYWAMPSTPAEARWLSPDERNWLTTTLAGERAEVEKIGATSLWQALLNRRVWLLGVAYGGTGASFWCVVFFLPQIVKASGTTVTMASLLSAIPYIAGGVANIIAGRIADRTNALEPWIAGWAVVTSMGLLGMAYLGTSLWSLVPASVVASGILGLSPAFWAMMSRFLTGTAAAAGFALVLSIANICNFFGPAAFGWVTSITGGYGAALCVFAGVMVVSGLVFFLVGRLAATVTMPPRTVSAITG